MYVGFTTQDDTALEVHVDEHCMTITIYDRDRDQFMQSAIKGEEMDALYWYLGEMFKAKQNTNRDGIRNA